jgi:hypothetical protein
MSEDSLQLSDELISDLIEVIVRHDNRAESDMMLGLQYLAAVTGYIAAGYPGPAQERDTLLEHLAAFTKHVTDDRAASLQQQQQQQQAQQAQATPKGHSVQTDDLAIGIWKPE